MTAGVLGYTLFQLALVALAAALGSFVQGAVGFALVLVTTPMLVWAGVPLPKAVAFGAMAIAAQTAGACWTHRRELPWREAARMLPWRLAAIPVGLYVLEHHVAGHQDRVKQVVGGAVLLCVAMVAVFRPRPRASLPAPVTWATGLVSGFLNGLVGMGGPPIVLYLSAHDWPAIRGRTFLWLSFLLVIPVQLALMMWRFPDQIPTAAALALVNLPVILLASRLGVWAGGLLPRERLRAVTFSLLAVAAAASVVGPMLGR